MSYTNEITLMFAEKTPIDTIIKDVKTHLYGEQKELSLDQVLSMCSLLKSAGLNEKGLGTVAESMYHLNNSDKGSYIAPEYMLHLGDGLFGSNIDSRIQFASLGLGESILDLVETQYSSLRKSMVGSYSWKTIDVLESAKKLGVVRSPVEAHRLVHAFARDNSNDREEVPELCFNAVTKVYAPTESFHAFAKQAWYDREQLMGAEGVMRIFNIYSPF